MRFNTADVAEIATAIEQDSAGNKQATMTDLDFAAKMLRSLVAERDQLKLQITQANEWAKGEHARICAAEDRQLVAEQQRDELLAALESMMRDDGLVLLMRQDQIERNRAVIAKAKGGAA